MNILLTAQHNAAPIWRHN